MTKHTLLWRALVRLLFLVSLAGILINCGVDCPTGQQKCGETCVDLQTSTKHCGACDSACKEGEACTAGKCEATKPPPPTCDTEKDKCGDDCVDLQTDTKHCGKCDNACKSDESCKAGKCEGTTPPSCDVGKEKCGDDCVDLQRDAKHCGKCDNACAASETCKAGICEGATPPTCDKGKDKCGDDCVDLQTDTKHCGKCDNACQSGESCQAGKCVAQPTGTTWNAKSGVVFYRVGVDAKGNTYAAGAFTKQASVGGTTITAVGTRDLVIAKIDPKGKFLWVRTGPSIAKGFVVATGLAVTPQGDVYVTGSFTLSVKLGSKTHKPKGRRDVYLAKLDTDGKWLWSKTWGESEEDYSGNIAVDAKGAVYVGMSLRQAVKFGSTSVTHVGNANLPNVYLLHLAADGTMKWVYQFKSDQVRTMRALTTDSKGNVYTAAQFGKSLKLGAKTLVSSGFQSVFVARFDSTGAPQWATSVGRVYRTDAYDVVVDGKGNVTLSGTILAPVIADGKTYTPRGSHDIFVSQWDNTGKLRWFATGGGRGNDYPGGLTVDAQGHVFVSGNYSQKARFGALRFGHTNSQRAFVAQLDAQGKWVAGETFHSVSSTYTWALSVDGQGGLRVIGEHQGDTNFGNLQWKGTGATSGFVVRIEKPTTLCPSDHKLCNGVCTGIAVNDNHCGACGNACNTSESCQASQCKPCTDCSEWFASTGDDLSTSGTSQIRDLARDSKDNVFVVGRIFGSVNFGGVKLTAKNGFAAFIAKLSADGKWLWGKVLNSSGSDIARGVAVDSKDNVYWTGHYSAATTFDGKQLSGKSGIFVIKMTSTGTLGWLVSANGAGNDHGNGIALDKSDQIFVTGLCSNNCKFGSITKNLASTGDAFVAKLSATGAWLWATGLGAGKNTQSNRVAVDGSGNIYFAGMLQGKTTFGSTAIENNGKYDPFVAKVDSTGKPLWAKQIVGPNDDNRAQGLVVDGAGVYVSGHFRGEASFGPTKIKSKGNYDVFVTRLSPQGGWIWNKTFGAPGIEYNQSLTSNSKGELLAGGSFSNSKMFGTMLPPKYGSYSLYAMRLDTSGKLLGVATGGGEAQELTRAGPIVDSQDRLIMAGTTDSHALFFGDRTYPRISKKVRVAFVAKLTTSTPCPIEGHTTCGGVCTYIAGDAKNCGACGKACTMGKQCILGACK